MASPKCQLNLLEVLPLYTSFKRLSKKIQKFQLVMNKPNQNYKRNECEKGTLNLEQNEISKCFFFFMSLTFCNFDHWRSIYRSLSLRFPYRYTLKVTIKYN